MMRDPVCGMLIDEKTTFHSEHDGKGFYFCCNECKDAFDSDPTKFASRLQDHEAESERRK